MKLHETAQLAKLKLEYIAINALSEYPQNAKRHDNTQIASIADSIREFGFNAPVGIRGNPPMICSGHGRVLAAKVLGIVEVPCVRLDHLTDIQMSAYIIADNKLVLNTGWNDDLLHKELQMIMQAGDFPATITGFSDQEISDLMSGMEEVTLEDSRGLGNPIIQYNIVFETEEQQAKWFEFIRHLKSQYPDCQTIAERIEKHIINQSI